LALQDCQEHKAKDQLVRLVFLVQPDCLV
jgi:hypothetical protein